MSQRIFAVALFALLLAGLSALAPTASAQRAKDQLARGRTLYYQHCASCHGADGTGSGPVAASLKSVVPDLHKIAKVDGKFPTLRVKHIIAGDVDVPAHGTKEMPVWGRIFRQTKGNAVAELNVYALTRYLEAIQEK